MSAQLSIRRLNATYVVPRELPDAGAARARLDAAMRRRLATTCRQLLAPVLDEGDTSVWLIRRLDLDLALDVGVIDEDLLTRVWASRIAASLARAIARGPDGQSVMRFPDRAAYLAHFLRELAEGVAWEKWYYEPLATLRSLPPSAAMREALLREPAQMEHVLLHLARRGWLEQSLSAMTEADVLRVYEACAGAQSASGSLEEDRRIVNALLAVWHAAGVRPTQSGIAQARNALNLYVVWRLKSPEMASNSLPWAINSLLGFAEILRRMDEPKELLSSLLRAELKEAIDRVRAAGVSVHLESLPSIQRLAGGNEAWLLELARTVSNNVPAALSSEKETPPRTIHSSCGGLFLLVPAMLDLNLHRLIEAAPYQDVSGLKKEQSLRYLLFLKIVRSRSTDAAYDFVPRFLAGFDELPSLTDLQDFSRAATAEMNQACLWLLLEELARRGRTDGNCLAVESITREHISGRDELLLFKDIATDAWVYAARCGDDSATTISETLELGLKTVRQATGNSPACLLLEKDLDTRLEVETLAGRLVRTTPDKAMRAMFHSRPTGEEELPSLWKAEADELPEHLIEVLAQSRSQRKSAAAELAYFSLMDYVPPIIAGEGFDLVWSLVARALMKEFGLRLMNFGRSSAEYLSRNFLEGASTLQLESGRVEVRLARPPLHIMLRIAGMDEQSYTMPWLNDTQVTLSLLPE